MRHLKIIEPVFLKNRLTSVILISGLFFASNSYGQYNKTSLNSSSNGGIPKWELVEVGVKPTNQNVTIRAGHSIAIDDASSCKNLNIEASGVLKSTSSALQLNRNLMVGVEGDEVMLKNDGVLGSSTTEDGIALQLSSSAKHIVLDGTGVCSIGSINALSNAGLNFDINQNISLNGTGSSFTAFGGKSDDYITFKISAGKTVVLNNQSGVFNSINNANDGGNYIYNIEGTLDLSKTAAQEINPINSSNTVVNISGLLKLGTSINIPTSATGKIVFNIKNSGLVDATKTTQLSMGKSFFTTDGEGTLMRNVGATNVNFPVAIYGGVSANNITLSNINSAANFKVSIKGFFDQTVPVKLGDFVQRQWNVVPENNTTPFNLTVSPGWLSTEQAKGFKATDEISVINYDGAWKAAKASITGNGGELTPYQAVASGFTTAGLFSVVSSNSKNTSTPGGETGVTTAEIGNVITPNNDGKNDFWVIKNITNFPQNEVKVYNRSGQLVFSQKGYDNSWNGTFNGSPLKDDAYLYIIDFGTTANKVKGYLTVISN